MKQSVCIYALCFLPALAVAGQLGREESLTSSPRSVRLQVTDETPFNTQNFRMFLGGFRCDTEGNVFFIPGLSGTVKAPAVVVRVSADGKSATTFSLPSTLRVADSSDVTINAMALDTQGQLTVLADVRGEAGTRQYLASFDDGGQLRSKVELDPSQIVAQRFAVFDSGDFLLLGYRSGHGARPAQPRVAVMPANGESLRDVVPPTSLSSSTWLTTDGLSFAEPATDGHVYFAPESGAAYAITPSAEISRTIHLVSPQKGAGLVALKISGPRLAAIYYDVQDKQPSVRWVAVHDLGSGRQVASYGPVQNLVMCYRPEGSHDRFTLLGGRGGDSLLFIASAP